MGVVLCNPYLPGLRQLVIACAALATAATALAEPVRVGFIGLRHGHSWRQLREISQISEANFVGVAESIPELVKEAKTIQPDALYVADYMKQNLATLLD